MVKVVLSLLRERWVSVSPSPLQILAYHLHDVIFSSLMVILFRIRITLSRKPNNRGRFRAPTMATKTETLAKRRTARNLRCSRSTVRVRRIPCSRRSLRRDLRARSRRRIGSSGDRFLRRLRRSTYDLCWRGGKAR